MNLNRKKAPALAIALGIAVGFLAISLSGCKELDAIDALTIEDIDLSAVKDGDYEALQDNKLVTARVAVSVRGGRISGIRLTEHGHGPNHGADALADRVLAAQSLKVDAVTKSTYSSKVVLKAIETALKQGL
jgi:uncharacterized protein with FMN-binding domain